MTCPYCRASNLPFDNRCQRCGRRFDSAGSASPSYGRGATARALQRDPAPPGNSQANAAAAGADQRAYQPYLFNTGVASIESYAPESIQRISKPAAPGQRRARRSADDQDQNALPFETVVTQRAHTSRAPEPAVGRDAHVAHPLHRLIAASVDLSMIFIALSLVFGVVYFYGGTEFLDSARNFRLTPPVPGADGKIPPPYNLLPIAIGLFAVLIVTLYELVWALADMDSPGTRWAHLRVVDFSSTDPTVSQRLLRSASSWLSILAAGLGVLWIFVDQEKLAWHDHISKTFLTPAKPN